MKIKKRYIILSLIIITLILVQTVTLAVSENGIGKLTQGVMQANRNVLKGETTMNVVLAQDSSNPLQINVTGEDTTYNFVSLKWIEGYIEVENVDIFDTDEAHTIDIVEGPTITTSFLIENYGQYTVLAKNSNGDGFLARITVIGQDVPTITVTKDEENPLKTIIEAEDGEENIVWIKIAKKENKDDIINFELEGEELSITPAKKVTVEYTFSEEGIYAINAKDASGNNLTKTVYIYKDFPIKVELSAEEKTIFIHAEATLADIVEMSIQNTETAVQANIPITQGRVVTTSWDLEDYGSYKLFVTDELGFKKEVAFILQEQVIEKPTVTFSPEGRTNGSVTATITFNEEDITITNNEGNNTYTFTQNGKFVFEYQNSKGILGQTEVVVDTIVPVNIEKTYEIISDDNGEYIKRIPVDTTGIEFLNNIDVIDADYKLFDVFGNGISNASTLATAMKLQTDTGKKYTLIVTGDTNGDAKVTSTDISQLKLHIVEDTMLTGERLYAADMNMDGNITITDLSQMKAKVVGM